MTIKCNFMQIYAEVGAAYSLSHMLLKPLRDKLNALGKNIPALAERFQADDFEIVYIISARTEIDNVYIKGPSIRKKHRTVEFSIFVPYKEFPDFGERIAFVLGQVASGIKMIFEKYGVDSSGIDACTDEMISLARQHPLDYQYPPR